MLLLWLCLRFLPLAFTSLVSNLEFPAPLRRGFLIFLLILQCQSSWAESGNKLFRKQELVWAVELVNRPFFCLRLGGHMDKAEYERSIYAARKNAGVCVICGGKLDRPGKTRCSICALNRRGEAQVMYERRLSQRICTRCGAPLSDTDLTMCNACRQYVKNICQGRYARLKSAGLCVRCGKRKTSGHILCEICLAKKRAA